MLVEVRCMIIIICKVFLLILHTERLHQTVMHQHVISFFVFVFFSYFQYCFFLLLVYLLFWLVLLLLLLPYCCLQFLQTSDTHRKYFQERELQFPLELKCIFFFHSTFLSLSAVVVCAVCRYLSLLPMRWRLDVLCFSLFTVRLCVIWLYTSVFFIRSTLSLLRARFASSFPLAHTHSRTHTLTHIHSFALDFHSFSL